MRLKKIILIISLIVLCLALSACTQPIKAESQPNITPTPIATSNPDLEAISKAFRLAGVSGQLIGYDKAQTAYVVQWTDGKSIYQTVYVDGILIGATKQGDLPTPTPKP